MHISALENTCLWYALYGPGGTRTAEWGFATAAMPETTESQNGER
jgi:hypothetical protein